MKVEDLDPLLTAASTDELIVTNPTTHVSFRQTLSNFAASIKELFQTIANLEITTLFKVTGDAQLADTAISGDVSVTGNTTLGDTTINGDLEVNGDIIQNGQAYETHAEKVYTKDDTIYLRDGAVSGLQTGEYTGIIAKHYDAGGNDGALVFNKDGEARVGDYTTEVFTVYSSDGTTFYEDAELTTPATIPTGVTPAATGETNEYTYSILTDDTEPLLTRDEIANMTAGAYLKWNATGKKAVAGLAIPDPVTNNTVLTAKISALGAISCEWSSGGNGSVSRFATMAEAHLALAIPAGQDGYIPDNGIVIVDELTPYLEGETQV